jgi:farnesyl-diphosphate farnesyltransferase
MLRELFSYGTRPQEIKALWRLRHSDYYASPAGIDLKTSGQKDDDLTFCFNALRKVSRSFAVVIMHLPEGLREAVSVFYLVCRALDTIEDDPELNTALKHDLLCSFHKLKAEETHILQGIGDKPDYQILVNHYDKVLRVLASLNPSYQAVILEIARRMGEGMASYVQRPIESLEDYDLYCHYVAGLVGIGLSRLFEVSGYEKPSPSRNDEASNAMGLFLQKTNIIRDYLEDMQAGRKFWPEVIWKPYAPSLEKFLDNVSDDYKLACLDALIADALRHVPHCLTYMESLSHPDIFRFCAIPQVMAIATLAELFGSTDVYRKEVKIRKGLAASMMLETRSMEDVRQAFSRAARQMRTRMTGRASEKSVAEKLDTLHALTDPDGPATLNRWLEQTQEQCLSSGKDFVVDVAIVGAGLAGTAAALTLARRGWKVLLVEKNERIPERIIGELMQPGGLEMLEKLGLSEALEGIDAQEIEGYSLIHDALDVVIPYPQGKKGKAFHHKRFLEKLRITAAAHPHIQVLYAEAQKLIVDEKNNRVKGLWIQHEGKDMPVFAALTLLADGPFSKFRMEVCGEKPLTTGFFLGLILENAPMPHAAHGHVILAGNHTCLVYPISSTEVRILIDFPPGAAPKPGPELVQYLKKQLLPLLPDSLHESFENAVDKGDFKAMPNHRFNAAGFRLKGACLLGDALNMRHPLTGGGMTATLTDVWALARLLENQNPAGLSDTILNDKIRLFIRKEHKANSTINILADALYRTMKNPAMREACLYYLSRGGRRASEPLALLSAISRSRRLLIQHFFRVALEGAWKKLRSGSAEGVRAALALTRDSVRIIAPLLRQELL